MQVPESRLGRKRHSFGNRVTAAELKRYSIVQGFRQDMPVHMEYARHACICNGVQIKPRQKSISTYESFPNSKVLTAAKKFL